MIYVDLENLVIRDMAAGDAEIFAAGERAQGWSGATAEKNIKRMEDRDAGKCITVVAEYNGEPAGYVSLYHHTQAGPFAKDGLPEIVDFNVLEKFRRKGIGSRLMDLMEMLARRESSVVTIGVGLHVSYGPAQVMYVKRGYVPSGDGVWSYGKIPEPYTSVENDDDLVLYLSKKL